MTASLATNDLESPLCSVLNRNWRFRLESCVLMRVYLDSVHIDDVDCLEAHLAQHFQ